MVVLNPKVWLPDQQAHTGPDLRLDDTVGILAFEVAAAMTRFVSLHRSLSDQEVLVLRSETMRSQGVAYLNSTDQALLLRLACAEMMDDLDRTAAAVSRLGWRCRGALPRGFDRLYTDLKAGSADPRLFARGTEKTAKRMEKYVAATARLYAEMEVLAELEAAERKLEQKWSRHSGPIPMKATPPPAQQDSVRLEVKSQRQKVRRLKEESLWGQSVDKAVGLMARAACAVFARICVVLGPFVPGLPPVFVSGGGRNPENALLRFAPVHLKLRIYHRFPGKASSGPLERPAAAKEVIIRNSCPIIGTTKAEEAKPNGNWSKMLEPPPSTVGGSGLALSYANAIVLAERMLQMRTAAAEPMDAEERKEEAASREELYEMLPAGLRAAVRGKLRDGWRRNRGPLDGGLAEGWKEAVERILVWLGPMAHDTVQWQAERNMDRRHRFDPRPRVLLLQTLHFSDREKTEAAIAEVLVGLSCVFWYEERRRLSMRF